MALGVGAWTAAVFHLFTHAFFKACLFLGAGSVSHSGSHHSFDMKKDMGGLRKYMPHHVLDVHDRHRSRSPGIFPLAGFWSKDEILVDRRARTATQSFLVVGLVGAFLTAAYMTRCVYLTFFGEYRGAAADRTTTRTSPARASSCRCTILAGARRRRRLRQPAPFGSSTCAQRCASSTSSSRSARTSRRSTHADVQLPCDRGRLDARRRCSASALAYATTGSAARARTALTERNELARAGQHVPREQVLPRLPLHRHHRRRRSRARSPTASYWFNQNVIDSVVNGAGRGARSLGRVHLRRTSTRSGVDGVVNGIGDGHRRGRRRCCAASRPAGCSATRCCCSSRWALFAVVLWIFTLSGGESSR